VIEIAVTRKQARYISDNILKFVFFMSKDKA